MLSFLTGTSDKPKTDIIILPKINGNRSNNMVVRNSTNSTSSNPSVLQVPKLDLDRLAYAVSSAETGGCKKGSARVNNCFGIRRNGIFQHYKSRAASVKDFKRIWSNYYKVFPTMKEAKKWTGNDHPALWLAAVTQYYNQN